MFNRKIGTISKKIHTPYEGMFGLGGAQGYEKEVTGTTYIDLTNAIANKLLELKAYGGTEQRNIPSEYTQVNYVTNTAKTWLDTGVKFDFSKNYEIELRARGTLGSWYILQARETASAPTHGISGSTTGNTIILGFNGASISTSQVSRINGNIYFVKCTINNGNLTLYVKDETAGIEETVTGTYTVGTGQSVNIGLLGNGTTGGGGLQAVDINTDIYFARIKEDGNYIMDYVPCRQSTTAGFYDKVIGTFKTTTDLVADGNTVPTPDTPMDIVCNNGVLKVNSQGQIYTDGTTETIKAIGKNLFDGQWQVGIYNTTSGEFTPTANRICNTNMILIKSSTSYTVSCPDYALASGMRWVFYDKNKNFISAITNGATTITTPSSAKYINFYIANSLTVDTAPDLQLEQGSTDTTYEPYYNGGTATAEMLLKVGNYQDTQEVLSGSVTRNVGIKVFDGTGNWLYDLSNNRFSISILAKANSVLDLFSTHYQAAYTTSTNNAINLSNTGATLYIKDERFTTEIDFKQFLASQYNAGTPVIIVYPLETPTTETVTGQSINIQEGTNTIEITQASIDNLQLYAKYKSSHQ